MSVHPLDFFSWQRSGLKAYGQILFALGLLIGISTVTRAEAEPEVELGISEYSKIGEVLRKTQGKAGRPESSSTTDHSELKELEGPFSSGPEVTRACLECHNTAGHQFMKNKHWTWDYKHPKTGQHLVKAY